MPLEQLNINTTGPETIVGASLKVDGELNSEGDVRIDGEVHGSISTKGFLMVGQEAKIQANISAASADVSGTVDGDIEVTEKLSLSETARIKGNITCKELVIAQGAVFSGNSHMESNISSKAQPLLKKIEKAKKLTDAEIKEPANI